MKNRNGFTLIELLVVIAIIALLLAILIPSLNKVKEKAKELVCKTHLKGIGLTVHLYLNDYDDKTFPYTVYGAGNGYGWLDPVTSMEQDPDTAGTYWGLVYSDYMSSPKIFSCPSFAEYKIDLGVYYPEYLMDRFKILGGYGINDFFQGLRLNYSMKVSAIKGAAEFIVTQDHVEPRPEGVRDGDGFWIRDGDTFNLPNYRVGGAIPEQDRREAYRGIFRHSKRSHEADEPPGDVTRMANILTNPNGKSNTLWLDGSVAAMDETTGENVPRRWYSGE